MTKKKTIKEDLSVWLEKQENIVPPNPKKEKKPKPTVEKSENKKSSDLQSVASKAKPNLSQTSQSNLLKQKPNLETTQAPGSKQSESKVISCSGSGESKQAEVKQTQFALVKVTPQASAVEELPISEAEFQQKDAAKIEITLIAPPEIVEKKDVIGGNSDLQIQSNLKDDSALILKPSPENKTNSEDPKPVVIEKTEIAQEKQTLGMIPLSSSSKVHQENIADTQQQQLTQSNETPIEAKSDVKVLQESFKAIDSQPDKDGKLEQQQQQPQLSVKKPSKEPEIEGKLEVQVSKETSDAKELRNGENEKLKHQQQILSNQTKEETKRENPSSEFVAKKRKAETQNQQVNLKTSSQEEKATQAQQTTEIISRIKSKFVTFEKDTDKTIKILNRCMSADEKDQKLAHKEIVKSNDKTGFNYCLMLILRNPKQNSEIRTLSGLLLKNNINSCYSSFDIELEYFQSFLRKKSIEPLEQNAPLSVVESLKLMLFTLMKKWLVHESDQEASSLIDLSKSESQLLKNLDEIEESQVKFADKCKILPIAINSIFSKLSVFLKHQSSKVRCKTLEMCEKIVKLELSSCNTGNSVCIDKYIALLIQICSKANVNSNSNSREDIEVEKQAFNLLLEAFALLPRALDSLDKVELQLKNATQIFKTQRYFDSNIIIATIESGTSAIEMQTNVALETFLCNLTVIMLRDSATEGKLKAKVQEQLNQWQELTQFNYILAKIFANSDDFEENIRALCGVRLLVNIKQVFSKLSPQLRAFIKSQALALLPNSSPRISNLALNIASFLAFSNSELIVWNDLWFALEKCLTNEKTSESALNLLRGILSSSPQIFVGTNLTKSIQNIFPKLLKLIEFQNEEICKTSLICANSIVCITPEIVKDLLETYTKCLLKQAKSRNKEISSLFIVALINLFRFQPAKVVLHLVQILKVFKSNKIDIELGNALDALEVARAWQTRSLPPDQREQVRELATELNSIVTASIGTHKLLKHIQIS